MALAEAERTTSTPIADARPIGTIAIAATFTAEGMASSLAFMLEAAGLDAKVAFAPYHQVFQELISPASVLGSNEFGTNVVLLRLQDFIRDTPPNADNTEALERISGEFLEVARRYSERIQVATLFFVGDATGDAFGVPLAHLDRLSADLTAALDGLPNVSVLRSAEVDRLCATPRVDMIADSIAHAPYTDDYLAALSIALTRRIHLQRVPAHKVLVLDCDNTIWRGVVGEDGVEGIGLDPAFISVQAFAVAAQARGTLICLASKNAEADVLEVFDRRPDMRLRREHIVAHRINWEPKHVNLRSLAKELNLGLDAFVFVDDNPIECGAMREALPEVVTLQLPSPELVPAFLEQLWTFDKAEVTLEDQQRTEMYRQSSARDSLEASTHDLGEFLASLELRIGIDAPSEAEWPRLAQLTQRTNQFNFTTRRRTEPEMRALAATHDIFAVHVSDRFGDYGLVGLLIAQRQSEPLMVDTFLLSCRVLGRGVEHAMVARLGALARAHGVDRVCMPLVKTSKNEPALAFAESILAEHRSEVGDAQVVFIVPAGIAASVRHQAGQDAAAVLAARKADGAKPGKAPAPELVNRSDRYARLASELTSGASVFAAMRLTDSMAHRTVSAASAPRTATERALVALWEEILGVRGIGIDDDFFALGGTSLQAARMIAAIGHSRSVTLALTSIVESPTIRALSGRVDAGDVGISGGLIPLRVGGARRLFLVHDGDGETLLYRNVARRLPADLEVYGIQPVRQNRIPLAHLSIEAMAESYVAKVREAQPEGPYLLGGMCAGGLIAFEMARQIEREGQVVERVLMLDAATPHLARKGTPPDGSRAGRLRAALEAALAGRRPFSAVLGVVASKFGSFSASQVDRIRDGLSDALRMLVLRRVLARGQAWPTWLRSLDFRTIYNHAERRYVPGPTTLRAVLVRARSGTGGDRAYIDIYQDDRMGWSGLVSQLEVVDVDGGHSSMLQEPHAATLVKAIHPFIGTMPAPAGTAT